MEYLVKLVKWDDPLDIIEDKVEAYDAVKATIIAENIHPEYMCTDAYVI